MQGAPMRRRCARSFDQRDWQKANDYLDAGKVTITDVFETGLDAQVRGSRREPYDLSLDWSDSDESRVLHASCTCPRFRDDGTLCKHIAAALLAVDREPIDPPPGSDPLTVVPDFDEDEFWYYDELPGGPLDEEDTDENLATTVFVGAFGPPDRRSADRQNWRRQLLSLATAASLPAEPSKPLDDQLLYQVNLSDAAGGERLIVEFFRRRRKKNGTFGKPAAWNLLAGDVTRLTDPADRELLGLMIGARPNEQYYGYGASDWQRYGSCALSPASYDVLLPRLCATGRFGWITRSDPELHVLRWDDGPPWQLTLRVEPDKKRGYRMYGILSRGDETAPLDQVVAAIDECVFFADRIARLAPETSGDAVIAARRTGEIVIPENESDKFVVQLFQTAGLPPVELPEQLDWQEQCPRPRPRLSIFQARYDGERKAFQATLTFDYDGLLTERDDFTSALVDRANRRIVYRAPNVEEAAFERLLDLGATLPSRYDSRECDVQVPRKQFARLVAALTEDGWHVEAQGNVIRRPGGFHVSLSSGVDWFELDAQVDYDGIKAGLPELLAAARRGDPFVTLGDGTQGMLPSEWLARYAPLAQMGTAEGETLRFQHSQALLLDAWLAAQPEADVDAAFRRVRQRLSSFEGVRPRGEPRGFTGKLRPYQREGLGWLAFLSELGFGGCLADDMGLGKTIQVLAMLAERRQRPDAPGESRASLVVVPRSLVQNWRHEAARFTPQLKVLDYTGLARGACREKFDEYDLVVTTYGTVRRDAGHLKNLTFDYAILDEAQAIKNSASQAAKSCRLLQARRRLAMTGTPVENHLGELWSIFEFLNPGMLGRSNTLNALTKNRPENAEAVGLLAKALRPFILRRTKEQVLQDLPEKTEQTLYCELDARQRKLYDELRDHYRASLNQRIESVGIKRAKIHVLEALLRLRQAACHPGLIDRTQRSQPSAKLETLLEQLDEIAQEGHKALVFSQFTSLLDIVRGQLTGRLANYEYLDGKTRDRQSRVDRFQQDPNCPLFLISLKAGGLGLNLTAADYVFILDPWWNPAVEAQAVDRAHRIGQSRRVFAYRLIARDTVEEKILQLQGEKRKLADAIITADNSLIRQLTADDLQLLLS